MPAYLNVQLSAYESTVGQHTFVTLWSPETGRRRRFGCFGGVSAPDQHACSDVGVCLRAARQRADRLVTEPDWNDGSGRVPLYANLRYAVNGVCHQAANRVSAALCIGGAVPEVDVEQCPSYLWSKLIYGRYGLTANLRPWSDTLSSLVAETPIFPASLRRPRAVDVPASALVAACIPRADVASADMELADVFPADAVPVGVNRDRALAAARYCRELLAERAAEGLVSAADAGADLDSQVEAVCSEVDVVAQKLATRIQRIMEGDANQRFAQLAAGAGQPRVSRALRALWVTMDDL